MLEFFVENYQPLGKILLYAGVVCVLYLVIFFQMFKQHVNENWLEYRSHPLIMPIAGWIRPQEGVSPQETTTQNMTSVIGDSVKGFLAFLALPLYPVFQGFSTIMKVLGDKVNGLRNQMTVIREFLFALFYSLFERIQNGTIMMTLLFMKLREGLKKSMGMMQMMIYTIEHSYYFLRSLIESPLGELGKMANGFGLASAIFAFGPAGIYTWQNALCFHPDTLVSVLLDTDTDSDTEADNTDIQRHSVIVGCPLSEIEIGEQLVGATTGDTAIVVAIIDTVESPAQGTMYELGGTCVSGGHLVWNTYASQWCPVRNHPQARLYRGSVPSLRCLVTSSGEIPIGELRFQDYLEQDLGKRRTEISSIRMNGFLWTEAQRDTVMTWNRSRILACVKLARMDSWTLYRWNGVVSTGDQRIYHTTSTATHLQTFRELSGCERCDPSDDTREIPYLYHFITTDGLLCIPQGCGGSASSPPLIVWDFAEQLREGSYENYMANRVANQQIM